MSRTPTVVILRALGLGDLLTIVPALRALADAHPRHRRVLATTPPMATLAEQLGLVDCVVPTHAFAALPPELRGCDIAVNLHGRGPESHRVLQALDPARLIAFASTEAEVAGPEWRESEHEVRRWCRLLEESGIPSDPSRLDIAAPPIAAPAQAVGATLVHPGAAFPSRRWPPDRWAAVVRTLTEWGDGVVLTGGPQEVGLCSSIARAVGLPQSSVLAGHTDVVELTAAVAAAARVVCGDTGVAHLATALGRPSVVLFGPVPPAEWGPPPDRPRHHVLWKGLRGDPLGDTLDRGLAAITISDVLGALRSPDLQSDGQDVTSTSARSAVNSSLLKVQSS